MTPNRAMRRHLKIAPSEEPKTVAVLVDGKDVIVRMTGAQSGVGMQCAFDSRKAFKMGWTLIKAAWKTHSFRK